MFPSWRLTLCLVQELMFQIYIQGIAPKEPADVNR